MPIIIKKFAWHQTEKVITITIKLPLKNVNQKDVDLLTSRLYIKASYSPYFFELFLYKPIDTTKSSCYIKDDEIIFELCKVESENWDELEIKIDKAEKLKLKEIYLNEIQAENQKAIADKVRKKGELKRQAVREQIAIDTTSRDKLENLKKAETNKALRELQLCESEDTEKNKVKAILPAPEPSTSATSIRKKVTRDITPPPKKTSQVPQAIPLPRKRQTINISFTNRAFPTPSRESKADEENEWLAKQAEARRISGFVDEDLRPEERNPQWLKDKGDEFFKAKNYLAAVSAYSSGIRLSKNLVSLYVGRSAAQFELGNFNKCTNDCSTALDLMVPICEANRLMRAECVARRGSALLKLGLLKEGTGELEAALKLAPDNERYKQDFEHAKEILSKSKED